MLSIWKMSHPPQTRLRCLGGETYKQCDDFSMDQVVRANFGYLVVIRHLPRDFSASCQQ